MIQSNFLYVSGEQKEVGTVPIPNNGYSLFFNNGFAHPSLPPQFDEIDGVNSQMFCRYSIDFRNRRKIAMSMTIECRFHILDIIYNKIKGNCQDGYVFTKGSLLECITNRNPSPPSFIHPGITKNTLVDSGFNRCPPIFLCQYFCILVSIEMAPPSSVMEICTHQLPLSTSSPHHFSCRVHVCMQNESTVESTMVGWSSG